MLNVAMVCFVVALLAAALKAGEVVGASVVLSWLFAVVGVILLVATMLLEERHGGPLR